MRHKSSRRARAVLRFADAPPLAPHLAVALARLGGLKALETVPASVNLPEDEVLTFAWLGGSYLDETAVMLTATRHEFGQDLDDGWMVYFEVDPADWRRGRWRPFCVTDPDRDVWLDGRYLEGRDVVTDPAVQRQVMAEARLLDEAIGAIDFGGRQAGEPPEGRAKYAGPRAPLWQRSRMSARGPFRVVYQPE